jgi:hypothetical protein
MTLDIFTKLVSALSPIVTVCLALLALHVWRVQLVAKRRFEIAEEALSHSQAAVYALQDIRNPAAFASEGSTRKKTKSETEEESLQLDTAFIPYERMNRYNEQFAELGKTIILVEIHLGKEPADAMRVLLGARNSVLVAARQLYRLSDPKLEITEARQKRIYQYQAVIWQTREYDPDDPSNDDVLSRKIDEAMAKIERLCRSALAVPKLIQSIRLTP